jgi:hypothetical protein
MPYSILATSKNPALVIYVLDVSASMQMPLGSSRRLEVVTRALDAAIRQMVFRSTKGTRVAPRYRIAMLAYSDGVYDLLDGIKTVEQVASLGVPRLQTQRSTDSAKAFSYVEQMLQKELPNLAGCPAPLVCHMTDGEYTGADPEPFTRRIMKLANDDGNVLIENIYISDTITDEMISQPSQWPGISPATKLNTDYAKKLRAMSSPLPEGYRVMMLESGYQMANNAVMMLPGSSPELVEMGFVMSTATPVAR